MSEVLDVNWFVVRVTYGREVRLKKALDADGVENFVAFVYKEIKKNGEIKRVLVPAIRNLIFIHTNRKELHTLKEKYEAVTPIRYIMDRETHAPVTIPNNQMENFMNVAKNYKLDIIYLSDVDAKLRLGKIVEIINGDFAGVKGRVVRVKRHNRVMVEIDSVAAVTTSHIKPEELRVIE